MNNYVIKMIFKEFEDEISIIVLFWIDGSNIDKNINQVAGTC